MSIDELINPKDCGHRFLTYGGQQQLDPSDKPLVLYHCYHNTEPHCGTTLSYSGRPLGYKMVIEAIPFSNPKYDPTKHLNARVYWKKMK